MSIISWLSPIFHPSSSEKTEAERTPLPQPVIHPKIFVAYQNWFRITPTMSGGLVDWSKDHQNKSTHRTVFVYNHLTGITEQQQAELQKVYIEKWIPTMEDSSITYVKSEASGRESWSLTHSLSEYSLPPLSCVMKENFDSLSGPEKFLTALALTSERGTIITDSEWGIRLASSGGGCVIQLKRPVDYRRVPAMRVDLYSMDVVQLDEISRSLIFPISIGRDLYRGTIECGLLSLPPEKFHKVKESAKTHRGGKLINIITSLSMGTFNPGLSDGKILPLNLRTDYDPMSERLYVAGDRNVYLGYYSVSGGKVDYASNFCPISGAEDTLPIKKQISAISEKLRSLEVRKDGIFCTNELSAQINTGVQICSDTIVSFYGQDDQSMQAWLMVRNAVMDIIIRIERFSKAYRELTEVTHRN